MFSNYWLHNWLIKSFFRLSLSFIPGLGASHDCSSFQEASQASWIIRELNVGAAVSPTKPGHELDTVSPDAQFFGAATVWTGGEVQCGVGRSPVAENSQCEAVPPLFIYFYLFSLLSEHGQQNKTIQNIQCYVPL